MASNVVTYITCWDRVLDDVLEKTRQLPEAFVINSSNITNSGWINVGDAWCYRQLLETFRHAKTLENYDYVSILFGDIYLPGIEEFDYYAFETKKYVNSLPDCYVYSTSFTHDGWSYPGTILKNYNDDVAFVCGTDTLYMTLHKNVVDFCFDFLDYFDKKFGIDNYKSGWAVDVISSLYSIYNKKNVFRNKTSVLVHYENSGYNVDVAYGEMSKILDEAIYFMNLRYGYDVNKLNRIKDMMFAQRLSGAFSYEDFYGI